MEELMKSIIKTADEIISSNLIIDISEQKITDMVNEGGGYVYTITWACPTSFLKCC